MAGIFPLPYYWQKILLPCVTVVGLGKMAGIIMFRFFLCAKKSGSIRDTAGSGHLLSIKSLPVFFHRYGLSFHFFGFVL